MTSSADPTATDTVPSLVLDTNVVLDWLVFRHPSCSSLSGHLESGRLRWIVSANLRGELEHVLARGVAQAYVPDLPLIWSAWDRLASTAEPRSLQGPASRVRCTDPDDQKFIDLALAHGARWLLSRDRAVLKLARRTRPLGLEVLTPEAWLAAFKSG
ncbi:PIN domain-containing protein [Piscinibacter terrae]|uniref:PIN domain-containing protein n=1 Tax=Piscinibacter terrae TaxID=2496871 RepID=A0A3N7JQ46_9BURK|nr:PIN domain-containing protein [Albitalea terrae]RQP21175.1 PIN domain-containing protein [Albitalea terrae]